VAPRHGRGSRGGGERSPVGTAPEAAANGLLLAVSGGRGSLLPIVSGGVRQPPSAGVAPKAAAFTGAPPSSGVGPTAGEDSVPLWRLQISSVTVVNGALAIVIPVCGAGDETLNLALRAFYRCAVRTALGRRSQVHYRYTRIDVN
jgi:hypothetical protein